jgi:6-pyruvoyltetrahydropterin/6-carboxytetrahydropterin synthase
VSGAHSDPAAPARAAAPGPAPAEPPRAALAYVARRVHFSAAHRLTNPAFSDERNWSTFGHCNNPKGHGHNYTLEVTVRGRIDPETGFVVDLARLKRIMTERIVDRVDHKHLNEDVDFLSGVNPTAENLAVVFWRELAGHIPQGDLYRVRVYESEQNFADYLGD